MNIGIMDMEWKVQKEKKVTKTCSNMGIRNGNIENKSVLVVS